MKLPASPAIRAFHAVDDFSCCCELQITTPIKRKVPGNETIDAGAIIWRSSSVTVPLKLTATVEVINSTNFYRTNDGSLLYRGKWNTSLLRHTGYFGSRTTAFTSAVCFAIDLALHLKTQPV